MPRLQTERLVLRLPTVADADAFLEYIEDPEAMRFIGGETGDRAHAVATIERWLARWEANGIGPFAVEAGGQIVGRTGAYVWDSRTWIASTYRDAGDAAVEELGWTMIPRFWGNGYATEAARAVRDWLREERGVDRLISLIHPENIRSIRVAEKLGCTPGEEVSLSGSPAVAWLHP